MENERKGGNRPDSVFSKKVRAGKRRTYFFDVKSTRSNDFFLTITESKKRQDDTYERFKIFLYKEDFNKFVETLSETVDHIKKELMPNFDFDAFDHKEEFSEHNYNRTASNESLNSTGESTNNNNSANFNSTETPAQVPEEKTTKKDYEEHTDLPPAPSTSEDDLKW